MIGRLLTTRTRRVILGGAVGLALGAGSAAAEVPEVLVSIAPVHSLAASVMAGIGQPTLLVPATASDHDYALRPSDLRKIAAADLVVWVGESLEGYLVKPLQTEGARHLELLDVEGVEPHPFGEAEDDGAHSDHAHSTDSHASQDEAAGGHEHQHEHQHEHEHGGLDPHVWLDPVRAGVIVQALAEQLAAIDPEHAEGYRRNAAAAGEDLRKLDAEIAARLSPVADKPFLTFHDGYSYFVERYGLNQVGQISADPEQRPGAAGMSELRERLRADGVVCIFAEPQFDPDVVTALAGEAQIKAGTLDAIGARLEPGPELYASLLRANAEAVESCLLSMS